MFLLEGVDQFVEPADFAAGGIFVDDTLGGRLVDKRDGLVQSIPGRFDVAVSDSQAHVLDIGSHGRTNMSIASVAHGILPVAFQCRFVVSQNFPPSVV